MAVAPTSNSGEPPVGEAMERARPVPLEEVLRSRRLVIEGKPGSGKTTFVRWIAWMLCRPAGPPAELPVRGFPLLVRISQLDQHIANTLSRPQRGDPTTAADARWIAHFLAAQDWDLDEVFFRGKLESEDTILLLDGLDEAANQRRRETIVETIKLAAQYGCQMVVTTRPGAHEGRATLVDFEKASIEDLDDAGIEGFLRQWCRWLKRGDEAAANSYYAELRPAVAIPSIRILARNPLMLTALAVLHLRRHRLPEQRAQLYEQIMDWLAEQAADRHPEFSKDYRLERFGYLALGMQEWKGGQKLQIGIDTAAGLITPRNQSLQPARQFLEHAHIDSGIVTLRGEEIAFWHRSFQESLAARTLAGFPDAKLWARARRFLFSPEGREVLPLLAGRMAAPARERLDDLFKDLTRHAVSQTKLERRAHAAGVLGNMLADVVPAGYALSGPAKKHFGELRDAVMAIFEKGRTKGIALSTRVAAAEAPHPSRPGVTVTWHEAQRYSEWAGKKWDIKCGLPTDQQWEFAARGPEGRIYAWGPEEPDEHRANFGLNVGRPTPVGMFPDGATPDGVADLAGNVWEWTRSDFDKERKCVRGASFDFDAWYLRAAVRNWVGPGLRGYVIGFRCVRE